LYDYLNEASGTHEGTIYEYCRKISALHAYYNAIPDLDTIQTTTGLGIINNQNYSPASQERVKNLRHNIRRRLDTAIEDVIAYLPGTEKEYLDKWKGSQAHEKIFSVLVFSARDFSEHIELDDDRIVYQRLRGDMQDAEMFIVGRHVSAELLEDVREKQKDFVLTKKENAILYKLKHAIVNYAFADALYRERISIDDGTIMLNGPDNPGTRAANRKLKDDYTKTATKSLNDVITYMKEHLDDYPKYKESDAYIRYADYQGWINDDTDDPFFVSPT